MKKLTLLILMMLSTASIAMPTVHVFVSFSMPESLLIQTFREAEKLNIPVYLKGFHKNSMKLTTKKIMEYSKVVPDLSLQIDPTLFEQYSINKVPAVVSDNGESFDVIYGNIKIKDALSRIVTLGESGLTESQFPEVLL